MAWQTVRPRWSVALTTLALAAFAVTMVNSGSVYRSLFSRPRPWDKHSLPDLPPILGRPRSAPPVERFRGSVDLPSLASSLDRLRPLSPKNLVSVKMATHALRLWGPSAIFDEGPTYSSYNAGRYQFSCPTLLKTLLNDDEFRRMYPNLSPLLSATTYGVTTRFQVDQFNDQPITVWPDCEAHVGKLISVLGEIGIAGDFPVRADGRDWTVADLINDSLRRFTSDQEPDFTAKAYLYYLDLPATWHDRFGRAYDIQDVLRKLVERPRGVGACLGTHACQVLALALRIDTDQTFLSGPMRKSIRDYLTKTSRLLEGSQTREGTWPWRWFGAENRVVLQLNEPERVADIRAMGHHLEWISIAPPDVCPGDESVRRAVAALQREMADMPNMGFYEYNFPLTHAARGLCLLAGMPAHEIIKDYPPRPE